MALNVLIVPDKFKGTLTAAEAAEAIARGWRSARPADHLELLPMSDGGDGFGEILSRLSGATEVTVKSVDAAHRPCDVTWGWDATRSTAIIESARVIGLAMLPLAKYHPFELDTFGLAAVLGAARVAGARRCVMGIGGSATNDGGFGVAKGLGWQFFNRHEQVIDRWTELHDLGEIRPPAQSRLFDELIVAVDVENPLLGPKGCTRIYGPQKGVRPEDAEFAERCLARLAEVALKELHLDFATQPGAGAAGGLGFGLCCFAGARLEPGFDLFARLGGLPERVRRAQVVITAEGGIDASTHMGKGVGGIARLCRQLGVPCLGLAGHVSDATAPEPVFHATHGIAPHLTSSAEAMARPAHWLEELAASVAASYRP